MNTNYKKITSFPLACKAQGLDADALLAKWKEHSETIDEIGHKMLKIFLKAINGEWVANFADVNQQKWYAWFWVVPNEEGAGFRVTHTGTSWTSTNASVGSRLCCETREQILHAIKYGEQMFLDFFLA